ncbi:MAG: fluoride efflux transporter CrcB [Haloarculaceae archaeon]
MISIDPAHLVGTGGAVGALARHYVSDLVDVDGFPTGTFAVNVLGSFALALFTFLNLQHSALLFLGTGACGSFTTFSSFSFETVRLFETGERWRAIVNAGGNLAGAGVAIGLAWLLVQAVA